MNFFSRTLAVAAVFLVCGCGTPLVDGPLRAIVDAQVQRAQVQPPDPGDRKYEPKSFVNFESPHVSPLDITPDHTRLIAVNTPAARIEIFDITGAEPRAAAFVPVGLEPVSVRVRNDDEAWVINRISDSVSIVDLRALNVVRTLNVPDEPADVVFAADRAFVACSEPHELLVFELTDLNAAGRRVKIAGQQPRALAVSPDGARVYAAIFESGNGTTVIRDDVVSDPRGPYNGQNPPPIYAGVGSELTPAQLAATPRTSLILHTDRETGEWRDANETDWSALVPWRVTDNDVAIVDAHDLNVTYAGGLMNLDMQLAVRPDGVLSVIGTEAMNAVRFEPVLHGRFVHSVLATVNPDQPDAARVTDLNPHLAHYYENGARSLSAAQRAHSIADPRAIIWSGDGAAAYVAGMGSNNVAKIDSHGDRLDQIDVGAGPTGLRLDESTGRLFVLNRFDASISTIDTANFEIVATTRFHDPTPSAIKRGRPFLYDARLTSGLGVTACGSCHVDARFDRLAWDLGDPHGEVKAFDQHCDNPVGPFTSVDCEDFAPMKGPMATQTLQGIIGVEPLHWRGDRAGIAEFNPAFKSLNGNDRELTNAEMAEFKSFLKTITFPPNPFREMDNSLPAKLRTADTGLLAELDGSDPGRGREIFLNQAIDEPNTSLLGLFPPFAQVLAEEGPILTCSRCHNLPEGTSRKIIPKELLSLPLSLKVPQLRSVYQKQGFNSKTNQDNQLGFGITHDGGSANVQEFLHFPRFVFPDGAEGERERRDLMSFVMCIGTDAHAAVGRQLTLAAADRDVPGARAWISEALRLADRDEIDLIVTGSRTDQRLSMRYRGNGAFEPTDGRGARLSASELRAAALPENELTWTILPLGTSR